MTFEERKQNEVNYYRAFNSLLVECTSLIVQSDNYNFSSRLDAMLQKIGHFSGVDRAYYFTIDHNQKTSSNTNEWCKEGVEPQIEFLQDIPYSLTPNWMSHMHAGKEIYISSLSELDESWAMEKEILEPQGIQSLLVIPVRESQYLYGFIGFDAVTYKVMWSDDSRHLLRILADNIGSVIRRNIQNDVLRKSMTELEETKLKMQNAQRMAALGSFEYVVDQNHFQYAETLLEILGSEAGTTLEEFLATVHPEDSEKVTDFFSKPNPKQTLYEVLRVRTQKDGQFIWMRIIAGIVTNAGGQLIINGTLQNINAAHQAEEEITRLSLVAQNTSNCVIITDENYKIQWVNDSMLRLSGYTMEEVIGKTPKMFQAQNSDPEIRKQIREKLSRNEAIRKIEILNISKDGREYWLEMNIAPIKSRFGYISGYTAVHTDITERKKMEQKLRLINEDLELKVIENTKKYMELTRVFNEQEKLVAIGEVAAGVAHDLNTPISSIMIGTESIEKIIMEMFNENVSLLLPAEIKYANELALAFKPDIFVSGTQMQKERNYVLELLEKNEKHQHAQKTEIADLLVRCRITNDQHVHQLLNYNNLLALLQLTEKLQTVYNLSSTVLHASKQSATVIQNLREYISQKDLTSNRQINLFNNIMSALNIFSYAVQGKIHIQTAISPDIFIAGNEIKLYQLWSNIIKNAIEAMHDTKDPVLKIYAVQYGETVKINFENNGPAIPEESLKKIFSRFYSTKSSNRGSGIGLTVVQNVVKEFGGTISIESNHEKTNFIISFPLSIVTK